MRSLEFLFDPRWRKEILSSAFGRTFWWFLGAAVASGLACWATKGWDAVVLSLSAELSILAEFVPRVIVALSIASLIWVIIPRDKITSVLGGESGLRGLVIATLAGAVTPGGPSSAFALLGMIAVSGADRGALVAYITAWATIGVQRILVWDVPFMGAEMALLRFCVSLPLPLCAGLIARRLPFEFQVEGSDVRKEEK